MNGVSSTQFAPNTSVTRGMFVTVLYRLENEPAVDENSAFSDVSEDAYYKNAVIWAAEKCIMTGYGSRLFSPKANATRAEAAAVFMRLSENFERL